MYIPSVRKIEKDGPVIMDLRAYNFLEDREIYISEVITDEVAEIVIRELKYLDTHGTGDIHLYINSPGGMVSAGMAIFDAIQRTKCDVCTICTGMAASMGAFLLATGTRGKRMATRQAEIMIHQPLGGVQGQATDIQLVAQHIIRTKYNICELLSLCTGKPLETIFQDCDRDNYMSAEEALDYGLIDKII